MKKEQPKRPAKRTPVAPGFDREIVDSLAALGTIVHELRATAFADTLDLRARLHELSRRVELLESGQTIVPAPDRLAAKAGRKAARVQEKAVESRRRIAEELKASKADGAEPPPAA